MSKHDSNELFFTYTDLFCFMICSTFFTRDVDEKTNRVLCKPFFVSKKKTIEDKHFHKTTKIHFYNFKVLLKYCNHVILLFFVMLV